MLIRTHIRVSLDGFTAKPDGLPASVRRNYVCAQRR
jgi:hypothetical protein